MSSETSSSLFRFDLDRTALPRGMGILGGGSVGGKARGLLFAARLRDENEKALAGSYANCFRIPRSVAVGTEVFEEFMQDNGLWDLIGNVPFSELQTRFEAGRFRASREKEFQRLLDRMRYPLAVRSSSLMEDSADHSFAGIYLTVFIRNSGSQEERLREFENALSNVYASTYNDHARAYRAKRKLADRDERMAVLMQRMVGKRRDHLMYPAIAGVAFSRNFYPWSAAIQREEGLTRLVFGLGTRAVGRNYARVVSFSNPNLRPEGHFVRDIERYSQEVFDTLNLRTNQLESLRVQPMLHRDPDLRVLCSVVRGGEYVLDNVVVFEEADRQILTFNKLLGKTGPLPLVELMRTLLSNLEVACGLPVDIEFAVTLPRPGTPRRPMFHLLQLRSLGVRAPHRRITWPEIPPERVLLSAHRSMGNGLLRQIRHVVYVRPEKYLEEPASNTVTRIAALNRQLEEVGYVLIGPGRWGTRNDQLGVPVLYGHICNARALVELSAAGFTPELSYGTHFFGDLFADEVPYIPVFPEQRDVLNRRWLEQAPGRDMGAAVRWIEVPEGVTVAVDGSASRAMLFLESDESKASL